MKLCVDMIAIKSMIIKISHTELNTLFLKVIIILEK